MRHPLDNEVFEMERSYLTGLAYRLLGGLADAEDAVQETWFRWQKQQGCIEYHKAWLTRVCTNICIDMLRKLKRERTLYDGPWLPDPVIETATSSLYVQPAEALGQSLQQAYMLLLERLSPKERAALLLHDVFGYSFDEVGEILAISAPSARKLASRGRKHITHEKTRFDAPAQQIQTLGVKIDAALAKGDMEGIIKHLAKDVELWSDGGGKAVAARNVIVGSDHVAAFLVGIFRKLHNTTVVQPGRLSGQPGILIFQDNHMVTALSVSLNDHGDISKIFAHRNPDKLQLVEDTFTII